MRTKLIPILAAVSLVGVPVSAGAEEVTVHVGYADLDLTKSDDVAELQGRLAAALRSACRRGFVEDSVARGCVEDGMSKGRKLIASAAEEAAD